MPGILQNVCVFLSTQQNSHTHLTHYLTASRLFSKHFFCLFIQFQFYTHSYLWVPFLFIHTLLSQFVWWLLIITHFSLSFFAFSFIKFRRCRKRCTIRRHRSSRISIQLARRAVNRPIVPWTMRRFIRAFIWHRWRIYAHRMIWKFTVSHTSFTLISIISLHGIMGRQITLDHRMENVMHRIGINMDNRKRSRIVTNTAVTTMVVTVEMRMW